MIDETLPTVVLPSAVEGHQSLWGKTRESFRYVWDKYADQADWFLKADDDSYVVLENLRYLLSAYDPQQPVHLGHKFRQFVTSGYMQGSPILFKGKRYSLYLILYTHFRWFRLRVEQRGA